MGVPKLRSLSCTRALILVGLVLLVTEQALFASQYRLVILPNDDEITTIPNENILLSTTRRTQQLWQRNDENNNNNNNKHGNYKNWILTGNEYNNDKEWENDYDLVHVVNSRFMQHQPNLLDLGRARLLLLRTFAAATLRQQTTQQFLWIIRIDPDLHPVLFHGLTESLHGMPNVVLIGSNEVRKGSQDGGFRGNASVADVTANSVKYGSLDLIMSYHQAAQTRTVLETTLDVDDGLNVDYIRRVQLQTNEKFQNLTEGFTGMIWCIPSVLEWQFYNKWDNLTYTGVLNPRDTYICYTPGLTWVTHPAVETYFTPPHNVIMRELSDCQDVANSTDVAMKKGKVMGCYQKMSLGAPSSGYAAIRARTPTSTGMNAVETLRDPTHRHVPANKHYWKFLWPDFGISMESIVQTRREIQDRISLVLDDALQGTCTPDHSCGDGIRNAILAVKQKEEKRRQIVH